MSLSVQQAAKAQAELAQQALTDVEAEAKESLAPLSASKSFATLDKLRADAVSQLDAWKGRARKKQDAVTAEVLNAITALRDLKEAATQRENWLTQKQSEQARFWEQRNAAYEQACTETIKLLQEQCQSAAVSPPSDTATVIAGLQAQLHEAQEQVTRQQAMMQDANAKFEEMRLALDALQAEKTAASPPCDTATTAVASNGQVLAASPAPTSLSPAEEAEQRLACKGKGAGKGTDTLVGSSI